MSNDKQELVPRLRFPEFRGTRGWDAFLGGAVLDQITNKDHNSDLPVLAITQEQGAVPRELIDYHVAVAESSIEGYKVVEVGDFIISLRSFQGGIEYSRYRGICSPAYVIMRLKKGHTADYFRHFLKTDRFIAQMTKNLEGLRDGKMVSYKQFSELRVSTPKKEEQEKIAACLSSLDDLIAAETKTLDTLKVYKKGLMQQLFPQEGETVPRLRFPEFRGAGEWERVEIGDLNPFVTSGSRGWAEYYSSTGSLFVRITNLTRESIYLDLGDQKFVQLPVGESEGKRTQLVEGDLLISITADIGIIGYVDSTVSEPAYINQHIALVRFDKSQVSSKYVAYFLASDMSQNQFRASTDVGTKAGMNLENVQKIVVAVGTIDEQNSIASFLSSVDQRIAAQAQKIDALKTHKKGLMQGLFPVLSEEE